MPAAPTTRALWTAAGLLASVVGSAGAQLFQQAQTPAPPPLKRVDPGVADQGPGGLSQRQMPLDQRLPTGFESVYQVNRWDPYGPFGRRESGYFARASGGLTAVFPRSVYTPDRAGLLPQIPPDTVFYIGRLPETFSTGHHPEPTHAPTWVDTRLDTSREAEEAARAKTSVPTRSAESLPPRPPGPDQSLFEDEDFRRYRVARLLEAAFAAR